MPKISVVVPVYNVELYLAQCVESLLGQTLEDIEILLVDDESTDTSLELARSYEKDPRVHVLPKPHGGLGDTRNYGVSHAVGEYLAFVDSDDWLDSDALQNLYNCASAGIADLLVFNFIRESTRGGESRLCALPLNYPAAGDDLNARVLECILGPDQTPGPWAEVEMLGCVCRRLFLRSWFKENGIVFPDEREVMLEDLPVTVQAHALARRVVAVSGAFYHYRYNPDSLSTRYRPQKMEMLLKCYSMVRSFLEARGIYQQYAQRHMAWLYRQAAHGSLVNCFLNPAGFAARWREVRGILRQPLLRVAVKSDYLKNGVKTDKIIRAVLRSGFTPLVYAFYSAYAALLAKRRAKQAV